MKGLIIARREFYERFSSRSFKVSTFAILALVVAGLLLGHFLVQQSFVVGAAGAQERAIAESAAAAARGTDEISVRVVPNV